MAANVRRSSRGSPEGPRLSARLIGGDEADFGTPASREEPSPGSHERPANQAPHRLISDVRFGDDVIVYAFTNLYGCSIGSRTKIGTFVEIERGASIGSDCKIEGHTFICDGVTICDRVFVGHGVIFINDRHPRATREDGRLKAEDDWVMVRTIVEPEASLGSGAIVLGGVRIGEGALVGAGAVVTRDVPAGYTVVRNPARAIGARRAQSLSASSGVRPPGGGPLDRRASRSGQQATVVPQCVRVRRPQLCRQRDPGPGLEHPHRSDLRDRRHWGVRACLRSDRGRLVPVERARAARADPLARPVAAPKPPGDRPVPPGVPLLGRPHPRLVVDRGGGHVSPLSRPDRAPRSVRARDGQPGRVSVVHEPGLEHRRRPLRISRRARPVLDPVSPDGRLPGIRCGGQLLHADGVGPDSLQCRLVGDLAGASSLRVTEVDALVGTALGDPRRIPGAAQHPAVRVEGHAGLPRHAE